MEDFVAVTQYLVLAMDTNWVYGINGNSLGPNTLRVVVPFGLVYQELEEFVAVILKFSSYVENNHNQAFQQLLLALEPFCLEDLQKLVCDLA